MESVDDQSFRSFCPWPAYQYVLRPSVGASAGILLVWNAALWVKLEEHVGRYTVSALLRDVRCGAVWVVTSVYGPNHSSDSNAF